MTGVLSDADLARLTELDKAATPGPWEHGDRQFVGGVFDEKFGDGKCAYCAQGFDAPLTWVGRRDINGTKMLAHVHTCAEPWHRHGIFAMRDDGAVVVVNDTDEYGYMDQPDAALIAEARNAIGPLLAEVSAGRARDARVRALADHYARTGGWTHQSVARAILHAIEGDET